jgi:uncharacterized paraquat-inducible protein A
MNLIKSYKNLLLLDHNLQYYHHNTFFIRFIYSKTNFKEIFKIFFNDVFIFFTLVFQIKYFYNLDLYFFLWTQIFIYLLFSAKLLFSRLRYKGFYKSTFKCLECEKLTKIRLNRCQHCHSEIHKNQKEYKEKRKHIIFNRKIEKIQKRLNEIK